MKKKKIIISSFIVALITCNLTLNWSKNTRFSLLTLANIEALAASEPEGAAGACPNGGYYTVGNRSLDSETFFELIEIKPNISLGFFTNKFAALAAIGSVLTSDFNIVLRSTEAYSCDGSNTNRCLACNRYIIK